MELTQRWVYRCDECGSDRVQIMCWVNINEELEAWKDGKKVVAYENVADADSENKGFCMECDSEALLGLALESV